MKKAQSKDLMKIGRAIGWKRELVDMVSRETGCSAQHNGSPCNTCFHSFFCEELGSEIGHLFWGVVLVARGDYTEKQIMEQYKVLDMEKVAKKTNKKKQNGKK